MTRTDHDYTGTTNGGYAYRFNLCGNTVKLCGNYLIASTIQSLSEALALAERRWMTGAPPRPCKTGSRGAGSASA